MSTPPFRRMVLELSHGAADPATMRAAAAFARLLGVDLLALFVEDETLLQVSGLPFAREISPVSYRWRPLRPDQLEAELRAAADQARRSLTEAAGAIGVRQTFEVRRGDLAGQIGELCITTDVVVVSAPRRAGADTSLGFRRLRDTAQSSPASVLFLPPEMGRLRGPVAGVVMGEDDPSLEIASRIATLAEQPLIVLARGPLRRGESVRPIGGTTPAEIAAALGGTRESLIVMTRAEAGAGAALSVARSVPVLVVEPPHS